MSPNSPPRNPVAKSGAAAAAAPLPAAVVSCRSTRSKSMASAPLTGAAALTITHKIRSIIFIVAGTITVRIETLAPKTTR
jgi:hypothetical protein